METNFYGPIRAMKAIIPGMRENKSGAIVNISSAVFWNSFPGISVYSASKFALEGLFLSFKPQESFDDVTKLFTGLSGALAGELSAFGIRVLIVEPGDMRTSFLDPKTIEKT